MLTSLQGVVRQGDNAENGGEDGDDEPNEVDFTGRYSGYTTASLLTIYLAIPIMRENEGDEREVMSDEEEYVSTCSSPRLKAHPLQLQ